MISVLIADKNYLSRLGLFTMLNESANFQVDFTEDDNFDNLLDLIKINKPKILVLDFQSLSLSVDQIRFIIKSFKRLQILAITDFLPKQKMQEVLNSGVRSYLLKECDKEEILEALHSTYNNERFLCGKIMDYLVSSENVVPYANSKKSCQGFGITERELDVIRLIAEGLSNKLIADKLELSTHTVNTHRKNIMAKLNLPNTAGIVMFAVNNQLLHA